MHKMSQEGFIAELRDCGGAILPELKQMSFKEYMRQKDSKFVGVESVGKVFYSKSPASLPHAVLCWICDTMLRTSKGDQTTRMLLEFVDLYGDINYDDGHISLDFPIPKEERAVESFVATSNSLLTAFEKEYHNEITDYQVKARKNEAILETFFADKARKNEGEAE